MINFLIEENMDGKMKKQNIEEVRQRGSWLIFSGLFSLLESKGPDMTNCMIPSSPVLLYLFRGVKNQHPHPQNPQKYKKKKRKPC